MNSNPPGRFSSKLAYNSISNSGNKVRWSSNVWGRWVQHKHNTLAWQVCVDALISPDRMCNMGIITQSSCNLCDRHDENSRHLFFNCEYSRDMWSRVKKEIRLSVHVEYLEREWNSILRLCKGRRESKGIYKVVVCACLYNIWREHNSRKFNSKRTSSENLAKEIVKRTRKHLHLVLNNLKDC